MGIFDFILSFLLFALAFTVMIFLYARISRLFKKKSYHYIVPPCPEKDKNWYPVDFSKYECFIFINNASEEYLKEKFITLFDNENELDVNGIEFAKENEWVLLKVKNYSFVEFKSLVWWFDDYSEETKAPDSVIGFCKHRTITLQDYVFKIDKVLQEENFIGVFRNEKNFGIYLPNSGLSESGNISLNRNHEIDFYSEESKLPLEMIEKPSVLIDEIIKYYR